MLSLSSVAAALALRECLLLSPRSGDPGGLILAEAAVPPHEHLLLAPRSGDPGGRILKSFSQIGNDKVMSENVVICAVQN